MWEVLRTGGVSMTVGLMAGNMPVLVLATLNPKP